MRPARRPGAGWIVLIGGGEFSFGATEAIDRAWLRKVPEGEVGFLPAASGSTEYGGHFATYLQEAFARSVETIPIYRPRDARRGKNSRRIAAAAAIYLGGGVTDRLLQALRDSPALEALDSKLDSGGVVVAIAAAAQCVGEVARGLFDAGYIQGFGWLTGGVVEPNFDPSHDRRLRQLLKHPQAKWGLGLPASSAILLGPSDELVTLGKVFLLTDAEGDLTVLQGSGDLI